MRRSLRYYYLKLVRQRGTPEYIALGAAVGVFIGVATPPFPFLHTFGALIIAWILRCSRAAAILGIWVSNPFTIPVFLALQMKIGRRLIGLPRTKMSIEALLDFLKDIPAHRDVLAAWAIGALVTGVVSCAVSYFLVRYAVQVYRKQRNEHKRRKFEAQQALSGTARVKAPAARIR